VNRKVKYVREISCEKNACGEVVEVCKITEIPIITPDEIIPFLVGDNMGQLFTVGSIKKGYLTEDAYCFGGTLEIQMREFFCAGTHLKIDRVSGRFYVKKVEPYFGKFVYTLEKIYQDAATKGKIKKGTVVKFAGKYH
jgi:hypothetical protein